ncbi:hypothetical protein FQA39_LY11717 [Lamprigera yunnana]|nr:hypothetical protein FQA39_LY11717 [Lamprigera yunnana]
MGRNRVQLLRNRNDQNHHPENFEKTVREVKDSSPSLKRAAEKYKITKSTVNNRIREHHKNKVGHLKVLSDDEEQQIVDSLLVCSDWGYHFNGNDLFYLVKAHLYHSGYTVNVVLIKRPTSTGSQILSDSLKDMLKRMRFGEGTSKQPRHKRVRNDPGKSVAEADFENSDCSEENVKDNTDRN